MCKSFPQVQQIIKTEGKMYLNLGIFDLCVEQDAIPFSFQLDISRLPDGYLVLWGKWRLTLSKN